MPRYQLKKFLRHHRVKTIITLSVGWTFIVLGILGLFLPFLQGIIFLAIGIALLANHIPFFAKIRDKIYHKHPKLKKLVRREHARLRLFGRRMRHKLKKD